LEIGRWVKGAKADRNAGRRPGGLTRKRGCPTEAEEEGQNPTNGRIAGVASLAACSTWPRQFEVERAVLRATPPVLAAVSG